MTVTRYDPDISEQHLPKMEEAYAGDYVTYDDYEELSDKLADTEMELNWIKNRITDIFREI